MRVYEPENRRVPAGWTLLGVWSPEDVSYPVWSNNENATRAVVTVPGDQPWTHDLDPDLVLPTVAITGSEYFVKAADLPATSPTEFGFEAADDET
jgi:hypothetical protein